MTSESSALRLEDEPDQVQVPAEQTEPQSVDPSPTLSGGSPNSPDAGLGEYEPDFEGDFPLCLESEEQDDEIEPLQDGREPSEPSVVRNEPEKNEPNTNSEGSSVERCERQLLTGQEAEETYEWRTAEVSELSAKGSETPSSSVPSATACECSSEQLPKPECGRKASPPPSRRQRDSQEVSRETSVSQAPRAQSSRVAGRSGETAVIDESVFSSDEQGCNVLTEPDPHEPVMPEGREGNSGDDRAEEASSASQSVVASARPGVPLEHGLGLRSRPFVLIAIVGVAGVVASLTAGTEAAGVPPVSAETAGWNLGEAGAVASSAEAQSPASASASAVSSANAPTWKAPANTPEAKGEGAQKTASPVADPAKRTKPEGQPQDASQPESAKRVEKVMTSPSSVATPQVAVEPPGVSTPEKLPNAKAASAPPVEGPPEAVHSKEPKSEASPTAKRALKAIAPQNGPAHTESMQASVQRVGEALSPAPLALKLTGDAAAAVVAQQSQIANFRRLEKQSPSVVFESSPKAARFNRMTRFTYREDSQFTIYTSIGRHTDLALQPGESLAAQPIIGQARNWQLSPSQSVSEGRRVEHVVIKPLRRGPKTDLTLHTTLRSYSLSLELTNDDSYMAQVKWRYPTFEAKQRAARLAAKREERAGATFIADMKKVQIRYEVRVTQGNPSWVPTFVFTDGEQTFVRFPKAVTDDEVPTLFFQPKTRRRGSDFVNRRKQGDFYVYDRVLERAELRMASHKLPTRDKERGAPSHDVVVICQSSCSGGWQ